MKGVLGSIHKTCGAFGHGPATRLAIEGDIDAAEVSGVARAALARRRIVRREDAADEADDGEAVAAVVAQSVDVPPAIAVLRNLCVEAWSLSSASAARSPESVAIGTPGPGWTLPPAR